MEYDNNMKIRLIEYLDGALSADERRALELRLAEDEGLRLELEALKRVYDDLGQLPMPTPSPDLESRFLAILEAEKQASRSPGPVLWKGWMNRMSNGWGLAAAAVLLLIGVGFGWLWQINQRQQTEIQALRQEMKTTQRMVVLAMLDRPSASERIRAVNLLKREQPDPKITGALIHTLNFDDMSNVRMKAVQALGNFGNAPMVKEALINSLPAQESPEVQIAIIDALVALGEKRAVPALRQMLQDQDLIEPVRKKAASGIETLL